MAVRGGQKTYITNWKGLNSSADPENIKPDWWSDSNNVLVNKTGTAVVLRSPAAFNDLLSSPDDVELIRSAVDYDKNSGNLIVFAVNHSGSTSLFKTSGTTNTGIATFGSGGIISWLNIDDKLYLTDGSAFFQYDGTNITTIGIGKPSGGPSLSYVAGGSGAFLTGVSVSYAYYSTTTLECSKASPAVSAGASTNNTLRIGVIASADARVDKIVVFITVDGGSIRYLLVDNVGVVQQFSNATGNIDVSIAAIYRDTLTPETTYNYDSSTVSVANHMFKWKDRIIVTGFTGANTRQQIQYTGFEAIPYGVPYACFPPLNIINIPNKADACRTGISTALGALILAEMDSYLLSGYPSDKTLAPQNTVAITEHLEPLNWGKGTIFPRSLVTSPFGELWLDQNRQIQLWTHDGFPVEIGAPIRTLLSAIQTSSASQSSAQAVWYDHPKLGGMYVLAASTTGSTNNKIFVINLYQDADSGERRVACWVSDIAAQCLVVADRSGVRKLYAGQTGRLREIFDVDTQGVGWGSETRFFQVVVGNETEYQYFHDLRFDAASVTGLTITCFDFDTGGSVTLTPAQDETSYFCLIDTYGYRKVIKFAWSTTDTTYRDLKGIRVISKPTGRVI